MANIWKPEYLLNLDEIDLQHKGYFEIITKASELQVRKDKTREDIQAMFRLTLELRTYGYRHFSTEEAFMVEKGYPDFLDHMELHDAYIAAMNKWKAELIPLYKAFLAGKGRQDDLDDLMQRLLDFTGDWWGDHILTQDAKYAHFIKTKGKK